MEETTARHVSQRAVTATVDVQQTVVIQKPLMQ